jgi:hypothetical protein
VKARVADDVDYEGLHQLLAIAGANVSVEVIARWSAPQRADAIVWAQAQIVAWRTDKSALVCWPEHVVDRAHAELIWEG